MLYSLSTTANVSFYVFQMKHFIGCLSLFSLPLLMMGPGMGPKSLCQKIPISLDLSNGYIHDTK